MSSTAASSSAPRADEIRKTVGNADESRRLHQLKNEASKGSNEQFTQDCRTYRSMWNKSLVLAGLQGCATAAVALASLRAVKPSRRPSTVSLTTLCSLPLGLALGYTACSAIYLERRFRDMERNREEWEMQNYREGEREEMIELYNERGLDRDDATAVVDILMKNDKLFVDIMMMEELGYSRYEPPNTRESILDVGLPAAAAYILASVAPQLPVAFLLRSAKENADTTRMLAVGEVILALQTVVVSIVEAKLLLGAYTDSSTTLRVMGTNSLWFGACFAAASFLSRFARCRKHC